MLEIRLMGKMQAEEAVFSVWQNCELLSKKETDVCQIWREIRNYARI